MVGDVSAVGAEKTWESMGMLVLQGKEILAAMNFEVVLVNYFAEVMIQEAGTVAEHVDSKNSMQQAVAVVGAADIAVVVAAGAVPLPIESHRPVVN